MSESRADLQAAAPPFALHVADLELEPDPLDPAQVVSGDPQVAARELWTAPGGGLSAGVWEHGAGVSRDVEADELFVVISGRATIAFSDGRELSVGPGDVCVLKAGDATTWTVHEPLRKVWVVPE